MYAKEKNHKLVIGLLGILIEIAIFLHYGGFHGWNNHYHLFRVVCRTVGHCCLLTDGRSEFFGLAYLIMSFSWAVEFVHGIIKML